MDFSGERPIALHEPVLDPWCDGNPFPVLHVIILGFLRLFYLLSFLFYEKIRVEISLWIPTFNIVCVLILLFGYVWNQILFSTGDRGKLASPPFKGI